MAVVRQPSLLALGGAEAPPSLAALDRTHLGGGAWIDVGHGVLPGADSWFDLLADALAWKQSSRPMYDRVVAVPRLIATVDLGSPALPRPLDDLVRRFEEHYDVPARSVGCNWYRDGDDSVAWHADRVPTPGDSVVAVFGLGERRPFLIRPLGGGQRSQRFLVGDGDAIIMGGTFQATWQHAVPKVRHAGPRISIMIRNHRADR